MIQVQVEKISFYPPSKGYAVLLKESNGDRFLPVIVGSFEAQSIALALEEVKMPRPMTHDLFCNILEELTIEIREVLITELAEGTFFSKILMVSELGNVEIDARPSDSVALALRVGAPIMVSESVMDEAGIKDIMETKLPKDVEQAVPTARSSFDHLKSLEEDLAKSIMEEEYETAAELRDEIKKIRAKTSES